MYSAFGLVTGIARYGDANALGGVRLPDLELGRAQYVAADLSFQILPGLVGLTGMTVDLACEPAAGAPTEEPRFADHGSYVRGFVRQVNELDAAGLLLTDDADALKAAAAESTVGKPGSCAP